LQNEPTLSDPSPQLINVNEQEAAFRQMPVNLAVAGAMGQGATLKRGIDRRVAPTTRISAWTFFGGRRKNVRRDEEREGSFVDRHGVRLLFLVMWIQAMNLGDSFFTLVHLQAGGIELNPVAKSLLETGRGGFVFSKTFLIGLALCVLVIHKNFFLARVGLWIAASTYTLLVIYHLSLF
jgi:hypothetical protein